MKPYKSRNLIFAIACLFFFATNIFSQISWSPIGPGGGGWLTTITVVNDADNTVYVGCDVGGIYKSTDHGSTWEIKNNGLSIYYVEDIAYDPTTPTTLYVATRGGIFKSTNGGDNWVIKRTGFPSESDYNFTAPVSNIAVDPNNPNIIYAGIGVPRSGYELESFHWVTSEIKGAIYKSIDFGESWNLIRNTGITTDAMIYSLAIDHNNSNIIYAATSNGVYKSNNSGETWIPKNSGLPHNLTMTLKINPNDTQILYVTLWAKPGSSTWEGGVYKSLDGGNSWTPKNSGLPHVMKLETGFTNNYPTLLIDKKNPQILYVGNNPWTPDPGVYKTTDGGENWIWISSAESPNQNVDLGWIDEHSLAVLCMAIDPNDSERLYFGTSMHLFKTENAGESWNQAYSNSSENGYWRGNGLETTCVQDVAIDPTNSNNIYAGYWDQGFLKSQDGGNSFKRTVNGMENYASNTFSILIDPDKPNIIYATTGWWEINKGAICKSVDYGENWKVLGNGVLPDAQIWSIALDKNSPADSRILYVSSYENGVYKTIDGGKNWFTINNGLGVDGNMQVRKITIDPNNSEILYAGIEAKEIENGNNSETIHGGLFKTTDAGLNWTRIDSNLPQVSVWDIEVAHDNSQTIYTAVSSEYDHSQGEGYPGGVYKSIDSGNSWKIINAGFGKADNLDVSSIAINPTNSNIIYATTTDAPYHDRSSGRGIFKSINAGDSWAAVNDGLSLLYFSSITIDPLNPSMLYASSSGNGIIKGFDADITSVKDNKSKHGKPLVVSNSPNPFNNSTIIQFNLPSQQNVTLHIYDVKGRLVKTLLKGEYRPGTYKIPWNANNNKGNNVASGLYFYRLHTEAGFTSGKMILLK